MPDIQIPNVVIVLLQIFLAFAAAFLIALLLFAAGGALAWLAAGTAGLLLTAVYVGLNLVYSLGGKDVALLDVFLLSAGFVLRVLFGCALIGAPPSNWLLLCSSALALFLALIKRRADVARGVDPSHRPSLDGYTLGFLDHAITITAAMTLIGYALYCIEAQVLVPGREFATLPFVIFGVLDYLRRAHLHQEGGDPVRIIFASPVLIACGVGWIAAMLWSVQLP